jgi:hypothetical protein
MDDEDAPPPPEAHDAPPDVFLVDDDMACIQCGYNLRGLNDEGRCPECGTPIDKTVAYVMERVLCGTCLAPNHPALPVCKHCGAPMTGVSATANFFRTTAMPRRRHDAAADDEPEAPAAAFLVFSWFAAVVMLAVLTNNLSESWGVHAEATLWTRGLGIPDAVWLLFLGCIAAFTLAMVHVATRSFIRQRRLYSRRLAEFRKTHGADEAIDAADRTEPPDDPDAHTLG